MRLILCGGGHVSCALAQIGALLEFEVCVLDDRPKFASPERFPGAAVFCGPFAESLAALGSRSDDFYCVLTRGHMWDQVCVEVILRGEYTYLGMIGSRRKVAETFQALVGKGFPEEQLHTIHAPIGLLLGGQTPAEVAVEIAAELVQVRASRFAVPAPPPEGAGVLCTITEKTGSAPRGKGAWMLVSPAGELTGSVGGGWVEWQVRKEALSLWEQGKESIERTYELDAAGQNMICGGKITVRFQRRQ